jgi:O-antigen ligase
MRRLTLALRGQPELTSNRWNNMDLGAKFDQRLGTSVPAYLSITLSVMLLLLPLAIWVPLVPTGETATIFAYYRWVSAFLPGDLLCLVFAAMAIPTVLRRIRSPQRQWGLIVMASFTVLAIIALIANPTLLGSTLVARWIGAIAIVAVIGEYSRSDFRLIVAMPLLLAGVLQASIGLWQHPGPGADYAYYGTQVVSHGTFAHHGGLALFLVFVITVSVVSMPTGMKERIPWLIGIGIMSAAVAGTLSRQGALALGLVWGAYLWGLSRSRRKYLPVLSASVVPFLFTATFTLSGWLLRVAQSTTGTITSRSSGRTPTMREALRIIGDNPIFGVGPGGYVAELARRHPTWDGWDLMLVHSVPLGAAAELGILAGATIAAVIVAFGWRALRTSPAALAVFFSIAVFLLLDIRVNYVPGDVALFAVWLATLDIVAKPDTVPDHLVSG